MHCIIYTALLLQAAWSVQKISGRGQGDIDAGGAQGRDLEGVVAGLLQQASRPHRLQLKDLPGWFLTHKTTWIMVCQFVTFQVTNFVDRWEV